MLPYRGIRLTSLTLVIFFLIVAAYAYWEARGLLFGPSISVSATTSIVHTPLVEIQGSTERISSLSMNGKDVPVTEAGNFGVPYLLAAGYNRIVLVARDAGGRTSTQAIEVVYVPATTSPQVSATSTAASSTEK